MSETPEYIDTIPEPYREVESIKNAGSLDNLLKQHVNLEKKMGDALFFPGEDADDEQRAAFSKKVLERAPGLTVIPAEDDEDGIQMFYNKLGRPEDPSGYEIPEREGVDRSTQKEFIDEFNSLAHGIGLNAKQHAKLVSYFDDNAAKAAELRENSRKATQEALKQEWGDGTDARLARVQKLIETFGDENTPVELNNMEKHPHIVAMLDKIADTMGEEMSLDKTTSQQHQETRSGIEDKIAELKGNAAYLDRKHQDHTRVVQKVDKLYEQLSAYKKSAA